MLPGAAITAALDAKVTATARLHRLVRHRDTLSPLLHRTWQCLPQGNPAAVENWAAAAAGLFDANAGAACHVAFWSASIAGHGRLDLLARGGRAAALICTMAGARAALALLNALPGALDLAWDGTAFGRWLTGMETLARAAPDCVTLAASHTAALFQERTGQAFEAFVATGLKAYASDAAKRRAFFSLQDPWAAALLTRQPGVPGAAALERLLTSTFAALWGEAGEVRTAPEGRVTSRATIQGRAVLLPAWVSVATEVAARRLYLATLAHAGAHLGLPPVRFETGKLTPIEIALVTLVEDARVESLAMRRLPGLRHVWSPFHQGSPSPLRTAPNLMVRLARALFDANDADPDGFVAKGRALFAAVTAEGLSDPALSLRIGRALGHDLGQMRVQFNAREYLAIPEYRDDGAHLWDLPEQPAAPLEAEIHAGNEPGGTGGTGTGTAGRARETASDERGAVIGTYPEWDAMAGFERPDWTTLRDVPARAADPGPLQAAIAAEAAVRASIARLVRRAAVGRVRRRRQSDGDGLDLDAAVNAMIALRTGQVPDPLLYTAMRPRRGDMTTLVLLDSSASSAARLPDRRSVLDMEILAVSLLAEALAAQHDPLALRAFASDGRQDVRLTRIKDFAEPFNDAALGRLAALRPALSTRLGTALRHAAEELGTVRTVRRLLLVMTDGEPSDRDAGPDDLVTDARRAVLGLRSAGIEVFGVVLDPLGVGSATAIFGRAGTMPIKHLPDLPARLAELYFRLARR